MRGGQRVQTDWVTDGKAADRAAELAPELVVGGRYPGHPAAHGGGLFGLALGALGIVFGDIGTSPLYAVQTVFSIDNHAVSPTPGDVYFEASRRLICGGTLYLRRDADTRIRNPYAWVLTVSRTDATLRNRVDRCPRECQHENSRKMEASHMHILNRVIAAGALVVPMVLGAAGVAMADVSSDSSMLPSQIKASTDGNSGSCRHKDEESGGSSGDKGLLNGLLGGGNSRESDSPGSECRQDDNGWQGNYGGQGNNGPLS